MSSRRFFFAKDANFKIIIQSCGTDYGVLVNCAWFCVFRLSSFRILTKHPLRQNCEKQLSLCFFVPHSNCFNLFFSLSENSDENMMDAYNIAVCFGPTLLPVPDGYDLVTTQANVNEIIKVNQLTINI